MAFQLSPGVLVTEKDLTSIIPAVATSTGAYAGTFAWGPVLDPVTISSENQLVARFGKPNDSNAASFYSAANFLSYSNNLLLVRVATDNAKNAVVSGTAIAIDNEDVYEASFSNGSASVGEFAAKYPGALGNSIRVGMADSSTFADWAHAPQFDGAPDTSTYVGAQTGLNDELHIIVIDELGKFSGVPGQVLEKFAFVSKARDARSSDGTNNYYKEVINNNSKYLYWMDHPAGSNWGNAALNTTYTDLVDVNVEDDFDFDVVLSGGVDDFAPDQGQLTGGFDLFANSELYDVSLLITGPATPAVAKHVVEQVAEARKDCVVFVSPATSTGGVITGVDAIQDTLDFRTDVAFNVNSSYGVLDSGWKYQYDRYNDKYRWVPLNADIAGLCARTDSTNDAWFSPGGLNRGQIKNVVKLNINPSQTDRDNLYKIGINPVVTFPGQGTVLFGDKTLLAKPSAFDRINVRRLFIVLEKAIATAAKFQLFEFNDGFTRAQFRSLVEPFLRDVQGRRGVTDFRVKCDETNNTGEVIDRNEFVADIFIKPNRAINFITLNFIAARSGISFDEIGA